MKRNNRDTWDKHGKRSNQRGPEAQKGKSAGGKGSAEMLKGVLVWIRGGMACYLGLGEI